MNENIEIITPELIKYAKAIVAERGIAQTDMTKEIMGDILKEALRRMDKAITRYVESKTAQGAMAMACYYGVPVTKMP